MSGVDVSLIERTMRALVERSPIPFVYQDPSNGERLTVSPEALASRSGLLPAIVRAGEAVWLEATGKGFELDVARDPEALLGFRLKAIHAGSFATVMLSSMEALHQVAGPQAAMVSDLNALSEASLERLRSAPGPESSGSERAGPRP